MKITNEMLTDYLTAEFGSYLMVRADGSHAIVPTGTSFRGYEYDGCVKCPGIGNLDSSLFAEDFAELGEDGIYHGEGFEGDMAELIRYSCENGDVSVFAKDLSDALDTSAAEIAAAESER